MNAKTQQTATHDLGSPLEGYIRRMVTQMLVSMTRSLRDEHLTLPQLTLLHLLDQQPQMRIGEMGEQMLIPMPAMSRVISDMVDRGLVERREDESDRRAKQVSLTNKGRALFEALSRRRVEEAMPKMADPEDPVSRKFLELFSQLEDQGMSEPPDGAAPRPATIVDVKPLLKE